jgi:hypothetical protein
LPEVDELWLACLEGRGPLAAWLASGADPDAWTHQFALHTMLACHPFPDLRQWSIQKT